MSSPIPNEITFEDQTIQISTFAQLEQLSRKNLMGRVSTLRAQVGADRLPPLAGHGPDLTIEWIIMVQQGLLQSVTGRTFSYAEFGLPAPSNEDGYFGRGEVMPSKKGQAAPRQPMHEANNPSAYQAATDDARMAAAAARQRNMGSSNIFG